MGQKQSYSLNNYNNKNDRGEVAQTFQTTEPTPVSLKPVIARNESETTTVDELYIDPELPYSVFVFDKENNNATAREINIDTVFSQPDGLVVRQKELDDNVEQKSPLPIAIGYEKLEYCSDEIVVEDISLSVDANSEQVEYPAISSTLVITGLPQESYPHIEHFTLQTNEFNEL
jgi:hypothetical protein